MNTSHNHLTNPCSQESNFLKAKGYLSDLSKPEKEVLLSNLGVGAGKIHVENFPDEEDLTTKMQGSRNVLKFKDKIFDPCKCSGMGRVFLRKNLVKNFETGKPMNILTQNMFEDEHGLPLINTIFIVQYNYNLDKGFITIPENSILLFAGGSFCNGTVILKNTLILPAAIDIERFMAVNIKGTYKEGSLLYIRKRLRLFDGKDWINLGGREDLPPLDRHGLLEFVKRYVNGTLDIVSPFKIVITPYKNYVVRGKQDILVKWSYNRIIDNQDIRLESGNKYKKYYELDRHARHFIFKDIDVDDPVTIVVSTTYRGQTVSEAVTLTFDQNPDLIVDNELDENSDNPVSNKTITRIINEIQNQINSILTNLGLYLTKEEADNIYATKTFVNNKEQSIKDWVEDKHYLTEHLSLDDYAKKSDLGQISYNDLHDKPTIPTVPTNVSAFNNDAGYLSSFDVNLNDYVKRSELKPVATSGSYNDLTDKPHIPSDIDLSNYATKSELNGKLDALPSGSNGQVLKWNNGSWQPGTDETGGGGTGPTGGGITESDLKNNLDIKHVGNNYLRLFYGGDAIGQGTPDLTGGGGDEPGGDGLPGTILIYYIQVFGINKPSTPANGQKADLSSASGTWSTNMPNHLNGYSIWMSQIYETQSRTAWGNWSDPILLDDGSEGSSSGSDKTDREYIYARANVENFGGTGLRDPYDEGPVQEDDHIPYSGWIDNPQGVSQEMRFEFISVRTKNESGWSRFSHPVLWSSYGLNGADGDGVEYIFYVGEQYPSEDPREWYDDDTSKNGGEDSHGVKYNSSEYIPDGSSWHDNPQDMQPGESEWVSIRKYRNDVDPESAETEGAYWHQYSEPALWGRNPVDIESVGVIDFDNQTIGIPLKEGGKNYEFTDYSYAHLYKGGGQLDVDLHFEGLFVGETEYSLLNDNVQVDHNKVTIHFAENELYNIIGQDLTGINITLKFTASAYGVDDRPGNIKIIGLNTGTDGKSYKLDTGVACIKRGVGTEYGRMFPDEIEPAVIIAQGNREPQRLEPEDLTSPLSIKYSVDDGNLITLNSNSIPTDTISNKIVISLYYNDIMIDEETLFVLNDGVQGIPATVYNIIPQSSNVINNGGSVTGQLKFKASRKYGDQAISYLQNGEFVKTEESGAVEQASVNVSLDGTQSIESITETGGLYTVNINSSGNYNVIVITLLVGQSETEMASIVVPITQAGSEGGQTLNPGILRDRSNTISSESSVTFYDGKNPDLSAGGIYYQDFIKWNGHNNNGDPDYNNWGTYLCVTKCDIIPNNIPGNSNFVKLDYSFGEVVSYLIADRAFIDNLAAKQVIITDGNNVVAGMTSGSRIPTINSDGTINPNGPGIANNNDIRIWAGETNNNIANAPFTVDSSGHVKAEDIEINGTGSFNGSVEATSFNVKDDTGIKMRISTWSEVSSQMSSESKALIDSNTMSQLLAHPDTAVIVVRDPSSGIEYLLNLISFDNSGGGTLPNRYFTTIRKSNGVVTTNNRGLITQYDQSTDTYYLDDGVTLADNVTGCELLKTGDIIFGGSPIYAVLSGNIYLESTFTNGKKQVTGRRYLIAKNCDIKVNSGGDSWHITVGDLVDYVYNTSKEVSSASAFNDYAFSTSSTKDVVIGQACIGKESRRKISDDQFPATLKLVKVNSGSSDTLATLNLGITSISEGQNGGTFITI